MDYNPKDYPPFAVTTDVLPFAVKNGKVILLTNIREEDPFCDELALLGGFMKPDENAETAALRILEEKGKTETNYIEQLATFTNPTRDPRMNIISIAHLVFVSTINEDDRWTVVADVTGNMIPQMAFDHEEIVLAGLERLRSKIEYTNLATKFLPEEFTLTELREVYETLWGVELDSANFQRKLLSTENFLTETGTTKSGSGRPAKLYRSTSELYNITIPYNRHNL